MAVLRDRDRLATRASPLPQVRAHCMLDVLRSGYGRETCPSVEHWSHTWSSDTYLLVHWYLGPVPRNPAPVAPVRWPSLIDDSLPPYQSSLLKLCRPSNKTVHHMRHCFCTHSSSTFCEIQTKTAQLPPALPTVTCSKKAPHSQDVRRKYVHLAIAPSLRIAQHANHLASQWECRSCRPRSSGLPKLRPRTPSSRSSQRLLLCIFVSF